MKSRIEYRLNLSLIILGISAIIMQLVMLRIFMNIFYGNELVIGIVLASWMFITGTGSYLGKYLKIKPGDISVILIIQLLIAVLPLVSCLFIFNLRNIFVLSGSVINIIQTIIISFLVLLPYCLLSGIAFNVLSAWLSLKANLNLTGKAYFLESAGSMAGAVVFFSILVYYFDSFQILKTLIFVNCISAVLLSSFYSKRFYSWLVITLSTALLVSVWFIDFRNFALKKLYNNRQVVCSKETPFGNLVVTKTGDQLNFFENGIQLFTTNDVIHNEEAVHYALVQNPSAKNILLISGGVAGLTNEILKYGVKEIDYVEIDPYLVDIGLKYNTGLKLDKVNIINKDPRLFIRKTNKKYDVVLINLPEPSTAQLNRYYSFEFFKMLKEKLAKDAVISTSLMSTADYVGKESGAINSVLYKTLKLLFKNVLIIPGEKNYYLASDNFLSINIASKIKAAGIKNTYVNEYYVDDDLYRQRSDFITHSLKSNVEVNRDFQPLTSFLQMKYWLSEFKTNYNYLFAILIIIFILALTRLNFLSIGLFTSGFTAASLQFLLIIAYQVFYGFVYQYMGLLFAAFMLGIIAGTQLTHHVLKINVRNFILLLLLLSLYSLIIPFLMWLINNFHSPGWLIHLIILGALLDIGALTGALYVYASVLRKKEIRAVVAENYGADLAGSAFGLLLISAFLFPMLGLTKVCTGLSVLNLIPAGILIIKRKKFLTLW